MCFGPGNRRGCYFTEVTGVTRVTEGLTFGGAKVADVRRDEKTKGRARMRRLLMTALALSLAACSSEEEVTDVEHTYTLSLHDALPI